MSCAGCSMPSAGIVVFSSLFNSRFPPVQILRTKIGPLPFGMALGVFAIYIDTETPPYLSDEGSVPVFSCRFSRSIVYKAYCYAVFASPIILLRPLKMLSILIGGIFFSLCSCGFAGGKSYKDIPNGYRNIGFLLSTAIFAPCFRLLQKWPSSYNLTKIYGF